MKSVVKCLERVWRGSRESYVMSVKGMRGPRESYEMSVKGMERAWKVL